MEGKILLKSYSSPIEAEVMHLKLKENEIPSWILNKQDSSYMTFGEVELFVDSSDQEKAKKLLV